MNDLILQNRSRPQPMVLLLLFVAIVAGFSDVSAQRNAIRFHDIADEPERGLQFERHPSESKAAYDIFKDGQVYSFADTPNMPLKWRGAPGVALLDFDRDGDIDIYVTNGPGVPNSLFSNQSVETGETVFVDVALAAGVAASEQDSSGVCFGDTDNDGDPDLFVLSNFGPNRLFVNRGDGTFDDLTATSGLAGLSESSVSCSLGDIDGDGRLDLVIGNTWQDMNNSLGIVPIPFDVNQHNRLYRNLGDHVFEDVTGVSGIRDLWYPGPHDGSPSVTWALALVDVDMDGDVDLVQADDQAGIPVAALGGVDRGLLHVLINDGTGTFTDRSAELGLGMPGAWMGVAFGDLDGDGGLDIFATNMGDWATTTATEIDPVFGAFLTYSLGETASRWFLSNDDGGWDDVGVGDQVVATPFGWGASIVDYDNDADGDIVYHGGMGFGPVIHLDNGGVVLKNGGGGRFSYDLRALEESTDHYRRTVHGVAVGDLDGNGFADIVSVSNTDVQPSIPLTSYQVRWDSRLDGEPVYQLTFEPTGVPTEFRYSGIEDNVNGSLAVELSSGNDNQWIRVRTLGTAGLIEGSRSNRDGIGAVVTLHTEAGSASRPVLGGASYASQDSLELGFGLGHRPGPAIIEVLWPGGRVNRFQVVQPGTTQTVAELPCDSSQQDLSDFELCVKSSLSELRGAGWLDDASLRQLWKAVIGAATLADR